jgi:hypothetical protein
MELEPGDVNKKMLLPCNVIRAPKPAEKRTLIVLGMPSGGTSMTAGALRIMGVNMGDDYDDANQDGYEFPRLAASLQPLHDSKGRPIDSKFEELRKLVRRRNEEKAVWGVQGSALQALHPGDLPGAQESPFSDDLPRSHGGSAAHQLPQPDRASG